MRHFNISIYLASILASTRVCSYITAKNLSLAISRLSFGHLCSFLTWTVMNTECRHFKLLIALNSELCTSFTTLNLHCRTLIHTTQWFTISKLFPNETPWFCWHY